MGSRRLTKPILTQGLQALSLTNPWIWLPVQGAAWQVPFNKRTRPNRLVGPSSPAQMCQSFASFARDSGKPRKITHPSASRFPIGFWGSCWRWFFRVRAIRSNRPNKNRPRRHDCQGGCQMLASGTIQRLFSGPSRSMAGLARLFLSVERFEWRGGEAIPAVEWLEPNGLAARQSPTAWPNRGQPCLPHG